MIRSSPTNQQGAALIVAMVMLVAMTVIGVTAARDTLLQVRMTDAKRQKQVAFEGAEAAVRAGEDDLWQRWQKNALPTPQAVGSCTPCDVLAADSLDPLAGATWNTNDVRDGPDLPETAQRPEFFIEEQQSEPPLMVGRGGKPTPYYYKVVGRSPGEQGRVEAILRTTFVLRF